MKAILIEGSEGQELEDNINTKVKSFKAFSGKGVMVGGN